MGDLSKLSNAELYAAMRRALEAPWLVGDDLIAARTRLGATEQWQYVCAEHGIWDRRVAARCPACGPVALETTSDDSEAYRYLRRVFEHCAPQCTPLPDMLGLCTQVANLIAGYRIDLGLPPDPAKASLPRC